MTGYDCESERLRAGLAALLRSLGSRGMSLGAKPGLGVQQQLWKLLTRWALRPGLAVVCVTVLAGIAEGLDGCTVTCCTRGEAAGSSA
jgi:type VI protein secretion system component VasF